MCIVLPIKPNFSESIFNGSKIYELRRVVFVKKDIKKILIYTSSPISKITGQFEIETLIHEDLDVLWKIVSEGVCVSKLFFDEYFKNKKTGYAIKISNVERYEIPKRLDEYNIKYPPQSFIYLT